MIVENVKSRGIEVSYLRYEDEGHGLAKRKNQLDCYPQVVAFPEKASAHGRLMKGASP